MAHKLSEEPDPPLYAETDSFNQQYNTNGDSEFIVISIHARESHVVHKSRPFDWFICSICTFWLTLINCVWCPINCVWCPSICAIYYAVRANHSVDFERGEDQIKSYTRRAKLLTLISLVLGLGYLGLSLVIFLTNTSRFNHF